MRGGSDSDSDETQVWPVPPRWSTTTRLYVATEDGMTDREALNHFEVTHVLSLLKPKAAVKVT